MYRTPSMQKMRQIFCLHANASTTVIRLHSHAPAVNVQKILEHIIVQMIVIPPMIRHRAFQSTKIWLVCVVPTKFVVRIYIYFSYRIFWLRAPDTYWLNEFFFYTDENEIGKLPKCFFGDNVYRLGEKFDPVSHSCHECLCTADFDNVTAVPDNVNCRRINCGIAILEARHIRDGCVPIYYGHDRCCPIDSRCRKWWVFLSLSVPVF